MQKKGRPVVICENGKSKTDNTVLIAVDAETRTQLKKLSACESMTIKDYIKSLLIKPYNKYTLNDY